MGEALRHSPMLVIGHWSSCQKTGEKNMKSQGVSTKDIRDMYGMTQARFAEKFEIPLRTVQNWEQRSCCPAYVLHIIEMCLHYEYELGLI